MEKPYQIHEALKDKIPVLRGCENQVCYCTGKCQEVVGYRDRLPGEVGPFFGTPDDQPSKPVMKTLPNLNRLKDLCQSYIDTVGTDNFREDLQQYIFEEVMTAFFGETVFKDYINKKS